MPGKTVKTNKWRHLKAPTDHHKNNNTPKYKDAEHVQAGSRVTHSGDVGRASGACYGFTRVIYAQGVNPGDTEQHQL